MLRRVPALILLLALAVPGARADDIPAQFSTSSNPSGSWAYGYSNISPPSFTPLTTVKTLTQGPVQWTGPDGVAVGRYCGGSVYPPGITVTSGVYLRLGELGERPVLRWTAPAAGTYRINVFADALGGQPYSVGSRQWGASQVESQLGASVAAVGDLNGDGYGDAVFGEPYWDGGQTDEGRILVYFGGPAGLPTNASQIFESNLAGGHLGFSVAAAGDVNGDGYDDVVAGMPGYDVFAIPTSRIDAGRVALYYGSAAGLVAAPWPGFGSQTGAQLGFAVAGAGDINADGYDDILVGEPYWTSGQASEGRARMYLGGPGGPSNTPTWTVESNQANAHMGWSLAGVGDENGDGRADVVVATPDWTNGAATQAGRVEFFFGTGTSLNAIANWTTIGGQAGARLGFSVAGLGDVNGDARPDLAVGQPYFDGATAGQVDEGQALVFHGIGNGGFSGSPASIITLGQGGFFSGYAVAGLGRMNGDVYRDLLVGFPGYEVYPEPDIGGIFAFPGGLGGIGASWIMSASSIGANDQCGQSVAGGADFDGDGQGDALGGGTGSTTGSTDIGKVIAIYSFGAVKQTIASLQLLSGSTLLAGTTLNQSTGRDTARMSIVVTAAAGQAIDLVLGDTDGHPHADAASVDVTVLPVPDPYGTNSPAFAVGGQRFAAANGGPAFDAVAFDPVHRRYASNGKVRDECGVELSDGPTGPGIAWDPLTQTYWAIGFDAGTQVWQFLQYDANGNFITTILSIPRIYTKPDATPDTLEDLRGIALDSTYVYLADAGPAGLQPPANAWAKFTRVGVPVAVREYGACPFNTTGDIVDELTYAPFASPTAPGRFLAAIEHTGIQVIDAAGNFVEDFNWSEEGIASRDRPTAFAGLGLDPTTGDLLLADNDSGVMERWHRLPATGLTSIVYGGGSNTPGLVLPTAACAPKLWKPIAASPSCNGATLYFGLAYRAANRRVYTVDYQSGELWRFDPRSGRGDRVGSTALDGIWGLASDDANDVLYALRQDGSPAQSRIVRIDPNTAAPTILPVGVGLGGSDVAFCATDGKLYSVDRGLVPPRLIRIDATTGAGVIVGPTVNVAGLDWDPTRGKLLGLGSASDSVFAIDPTSGAATFVGHSGFGGWEGLAVAPVGPLPALAAPPPGASDATASVRLAGNPFRGALHVRLALAGAADVALEIYDVAGRRLFHDERALLAAGEHDLAWDGRTANGAARPGVYFARVRMGTQTRTLTAVRIE